MNILLVEDDDRVSSFLKAGLEAEDFSVTLSITAQDAQAKAAAGGYDVIVTDVMLPDRSGKELCTRLRQMRVQTPILMLTALDAVEDKIEGLRSGADDYLTKPFDFDELLARLEALVRRARGHDVGKDAKRLSGAGIELDRETHQVFCNGAEVSMTPIEFQLLEMLLESSGKMLGRSHILSRVWGYDTDPLTNVVDVYIRRLRTKLAMDAENGAIRSVRGYGYRFVDAAAQP